MPRSPRLEAAPHATQALRLDLTHALTGQAVDLSDRGEGHRRLAVQAVAADQDRLPQGRQLVGQRRDHRDVLVDQQRVERLGCSPVGKNVSPTMRAAGADDVVEGHVLEKPAMERTGAGPADDRGMARDEGLHPPPRPPGRVGEELHAARCVEAQRRVEEAETSLGFQVLARDARLCELLRDP
jgi:hypothetical protein